MLHQFFGTWKIGKFFWSGNIWQFCSAWLGSLTCLDYFGFILQQFCAKCNVAFPVALYVGYFYAWDNFAMTGHVRIAQTCSNNLNHAQTILNTIQNWITWRIPLAGADGNRQSWQSSWWRTSWGRSWCCEGPEEIEIKMAKETHLNWRSEKEWCSWMHKPQCIPAEQAWKHVWWFFWYVSDQVISAYDAAAATKIYQDLKVPVAVWPCLMALG